MAGYIGTTPVPQATQHRESFTATGGQTSFATAGYTPQFIDVYLNGVKLAPADFTATNGSDVVLASGATASDILEIVAYTPFEVANQTFTGTTTAANLTVTGAFTSQGIDDNADAVAITIDSSENVGIGTSSPTGKAHVFSGASGGSPTADLIVEDNLNVQIMLACPSANQGILSFADPASNNAGRIRYLHVDDSMRFDTDATEAMRIDSSGNLLVGKTAQDQTVVGAEIRDNGIAAFTADASAPLRANRNTSDGSIVNFLKDGSTVGSIRSVAGAYMAMGKGNTGLLFQDGLNEITPYDISAGANEDAAINLGKSNARFQDLYLSGGVYLGGTGSANHLDDYEEGTWTPTMTQGTVSPEFAKYRKVGNLVTVSVNLQDITNHTSNTTVVISGLPFTSSGKHICPIFYRYINNSVISDVVGYLGSGQTQIEVYYSRRDGNNWSGLLYNSASQANWDLMLTMTYMTAA